MAVLAVSMITGSTITALIFDLDTNYSQNDRYVQWYANGIYKGTSYIYAYESVSSEFTLTGLMPNTLYSITATIYYGNGQYSTTLYYDTFTGDANPRPPNFYWNFYPKYSGDVFNITAAEWNAYTENINAVRLYRGYSSYSFAYVFSGDVFMYFHNNQAVEAIQQISGYGGYLTRVSGGDVVTAYHVNNLVTELNAVL